MRHCIDAQLRVGPANKRAGEGDPLWSEALANEENNSKRSLDDPMLEVENAKPGESQQAQKSEQLIAPLHERDVEGPPMIVKPDKA